MTLFQNISALALSTSNPCALANRCAEKQAITTRAKTPRFVARFNSRLAEKHSGHIDLLMTDVVMPGMNGRELAERLLKLHPEMQGLFTSGYTEDVIVHISLATRYDPYIEFRPICDI